MVGVPQAIASIITRPNGSGQSIGSSNRLGAAEERGLFRIANFTDELDLVAVDHRPNSDVSKVFA